MISIYTIFNTTGDVIGIVVVESGCVLVYCDLDSNIANKTVNCPTTASSTSTPFVETTEPTKYCQYNNFQYMPGICISDDGSLMSQLYIVNINDFIF